MRSFDSIPGDPVLKDFGYKTDNPGEEYCQRKQNSALKYRETELRGAREGLHGKLASGPVTAHMGIFKPMYISTKLLVHLEGANEEHFYRREGDVKFDRLLQTVRDNGWKQEHPVMVRVNHLGHACIMEGNTRTAVAKALGIPKLLVQFEWVNGAENAADDLWSPQRVAALADTQPPVVNLAESDDHYQPIRLKKETVLYRSVSMPELRDIVKTKRIRGGQNRFNDFDGRRLVFFGDKVNERLIHQGEETERQAHHSMSQHPINRQFTNLIDRAKEEGSYAATLMGQAGVVLPENYREALVSGQNGGVLYFTKRAKEITDEGIRHRVLNALRKVKEIFDEVTELQNRFRKLYHAEHQMADQRKQSLHYTSAILETRPLSGAIHYSRRHGEGAVSGMGEDDEYGFRPDELSLEDITGVMLVSHGDVVETISVDDLINRINDISDTRKY